MTAVLERRGTFDDERATRRLCSCGQHYITGGAVLGCPWKRETVGRWQCRWAQPDREWGAE